MNERRRARQDIQRVQLFNLLGSGMSLSKVAKELDITYETAKRLKEQGLCCCGGPITPNCKGCKQ